MCPAWAFATFPKLGPEVWNPDRKAAYRDGSGLVLGDFMTNNTIHNENGGIVFRKKETLGPAGAQPAMRASRTLTD